VTVRALLSGGDGSDTEIDLSDWQPGGARSDQLVWIDVDRTDRHELKELERALGINDGLAEELTSIPTEPDARVHAHGIEVVILALAETLDDEPIPLRILCGDGWVITHHVDAVPFLDAHRERSQDGRDVGHLSSLEFLASLLDRHVDTFFEAAEALEARVDELDDAALRANGDLLGRLVAMRRRIAHVRGILTPHRELAAELLRPDFLHSTDDGAAAALNAVGQRLDRAGDAISRAREMLIGTFDVHMTRMAQRTNDTMRLLTLASVILLPSVVLAGIMGMNFKVALFDEPSLFYVVIGAMVLMAVATLAVARWRHWL
jgi:magnesium transporter